MLKKTNLHHRDIQNKIKNKKLYEEACSGFPSPVQAKAHGERWLYNFDKSRKDIYYVREYKGDNWTYLKKRNNRLLRRRLKNAEYECQNGNSYRKHVELWYEYI